MNHVGRLAGDVVVVGLDVHKDSISAAVADGDTSVLRSDRFVHDEICIRRFFGRFDGRAVAACYEAGPTGYGLARLLESMKVHCDVIAPSLIPAVVAKRVKTDKRDAIRLCRLYRAGELTPVRIPTVEEEAVRDLGRLRDDAVSDLTRARHRLSKFLLRNGRVWRDGVAWTHKHESWLHRQRFDERAQQLTFQHYLGEVEARGATVDAVSTDLASWYDREPFSDGVRRLRCYRGITDLGALKLVSEIGDYRRFGGAGVFMSFCGLTPSEYSSGNKTTRGGITHAGNTHVRHQLVESGWAYQHRPAVGAILANRQVGADPETVARAWRAQLRLTAKFRRMAAKNKNRNVIVTAVARELAGFVWAELAH